MKSRQIIFIALTSCISAVATVAMYIRFGPQQEITAIHYSEAPVRYAGYIDEANEAADGAADFTKAVSAALPAVVRIKTKTSPRRLTNGSNGTNDSFPGSFRSGFRMPRSGSGSGVILSDDGYILTANQVITDRRGNPASEITVTLNNSKTYEAKLIGRDAAADVAVLKIEGKNLPHLVFGNSSEIQTGQWVLAIGYPLSLDATVTAGIISSTGNRIAATTRQVKDGETPNRSFIQTDAALNNGNSGGALVNVNGELIGINSGIISPTGTYAGYSFAVPVNTVKKAVKEIIESSGVQPGRN